MGSAQIATDAGEKNQRAIDKTKTNHKLDPVDHWWHFVGLPKNTVKRARQPFSRLATVATLPVGRYSCHLSLAID
jgi:hypothetical protein